MTKEQSNTYDMISNVLVLQSLIKEHTLEDELCGDHVVIPSEKLEGILTRIRTSLTLTCEKEFNRASKRDRYTKSDKPLVDAVLLMNTKLNGKGNTNEPQTDNRPREVDMGETRKYAPFGGIKVNED